MSTRSARRFVGVIASACLLLGAALAGPSAPVLAAGISVNSLADPGDGTCDATECTLREAITAANADGDATTIAFAAGLNGTIELLSELPALATDMAIDGPGARRLTVHRSSGGDYRIFSISAGTVSIGGLTISGGGNDVTGAGVSNTSSDPATLTGVTITDNTASSGSNIRQGGGVYNNGTLTIERSLIKDNTAYAQGGGIYNLGTMNVHNTTITGNQVTEADGVRGQGGGVYNDGGTLTLDSATITLNHADGTSTGRGGGIEDNGDATLVNTIVANNSDQFGRPDISGSFADGGHNLIEDTAGPPAASGFTDPSDVFGQDPDLGALANNGGPTNTQLPSTSSPALNAGATTLTVDQRNVDRPQNSSDDIGAVERRLCPSLDPLVVTTTAESSVADDCVISLREALTAANSSAGADTITFALPGNGVHTITPTSALPTITDAVMINGYSQSGASAATSNANAVITVEVDGSDAGAGADGFDITADNTTIKGLAVTHFRNGFSLHGDGAHDNVISGNRIGIDAGGSKAKNTNDGVLIHGRAHDNTVGGSTAAKRNVISGNGGNGVELNGDGETNNPEHTINNVVQGNYIGTNATGTAAIANGADGVLVTSGASPNVVSSNVISGNGDAGVETTDIHATNMQVNGNLIGTDVTGTVALGNTSDGFRSSNNGGVVLDGNVISANGGNGVHLGTGTGGFGMQFNYVGTGAGGTGSLGNHLNGILDVDSLFHTIGAVRPDASGGNVIAHNQLAGIAENGGQSKLFYSNSIFDNGGLGIDLGNDGVTANDDKDPDTGANDLQNYPVITGVMQVSGGIKVTGTINSTPNSTFDLQFFSNASADPSGHGEGHTHLGNGTVDTDGNGDGSFTATVGNPTGFEITALATDHNSLAGTSEFSAAFHFAHADLSIAKHAAAIARVGKPFQYTVQVHNAGPDAAKNVVVRDNLPPGLTYVDASSNRSCDPDSGTPDTNDVICHLGIVGNGITRKLVIAVQTTIGGTYRNVATVGSSTADPNKANNHSSSVSTSARYRFSWVPPTKDQPGINTFHAGSIARIHFSLGGDFGLNVLRAGSPFQQLYASCPVGGLRPGSRASTVPAGSGLTFNATSGVYTYSWQTNSHWYPNGACRQFQLVLRDGRTYRLNIEFVAPTPPGKAEGPQTP